MCKKNIKYLLKKYYFIFILNLEGKELYAKIYKEIFIKDYALKKQIRDNIWVVKIENNNYYLYIYEDTEIISGFNNYNEAELLEYRKEINTEKRIFKNKEFLNKIKEVQKNSSYLFRLLKNNNSKKKNNNNNLNQRCLFDFDTFSI